MFDKGISFDISKKVRKSYMDRVSLQSCNKGNSKIKVNCFFISKLIDIYST